MFSVAPILPDPLAEPVHLSPDTLAPLYPVRSDAERCNESDDQHERSEHADDDDIL